MAKNRGKEKDLAVVIMAGGKGRRFWPRSRESIPKQLLPITGGAPLVKETVDRVLGLVPQERIFISCDKGLSKKISGLVREIPLQNYVIEPEGRDTAPCIGLAMRHASAYCPEREDAVVAVLPSDHSILRPARFRKVLLEAARAARSMDVIVTIGIKPDRPTSSYGYIQPGAAVAESSGIAKVKNFKEKPDAALAKKYMARGYLWNAGMFVSRAKIMLEAYARHLPTMTAPLEKIGAAMGTPGQARVIAREFGRLEKVSVDYGVMEKADNVVVIEGDFGWSDVGGWDALYRLRGGDGEKNVLDKECISVGSRGCLASGSKVIALLGVDDLVVVDTDDALLVMRRDKEDDLKSLIKTLESRGKKEVL